jgi:hypothetical protein
MKTKLPKENIEAHDAKDSIYELLLHVSKESKGVFTLISYMRNTRFSDLIVDLAAHIRITPLDSDGYEAYLVIEKIEPFKPVELLKDHMDLLAKTLQSLNQTKAYGVVAADRLSSEARKAIKDRGLLYMDAKRKEIYISLPGFFFSQSVETSSVGGSVKSLQEIVDGRGQERTKAGMALRELECKGTDYIWTLAELSKRSRISAAAAHKLKMRLLDMGIVVPSPSTKGMTRFCLSAEGKKALITLELPIQK